MYAVHQIAKYSSCPNHEHGEGIVYLVRYLMRTQDLGFKFKPDPSNGFENYCDTNFSGNWLRSDAEYDPSTAKSRSVWITFYAGSPIIWSSKLQTQVALSTTKAEYIALSQSLRDVIPVMQFLEEMRSCGFKVICTELHVYCKTFEDNSGALKLDCLPKLRPRTKHINVCYHHFASMCEGASSRSSQSTLTTKLQMPSPSPYRRTLSLAIVGICLVNAAHPRVAL